MKNPKLMLGVGALIIIILAVLLFIPKKAQAPSDNLITSGQEKTGDTASQKTLSGLFKMGKNIECSFSHEVDGVNSQGVIYISGKKMRGDFSTTIKGSAQDSSMIHDGEYSYIWGSAMPKGIKIKQSTEADSPFNNESKKYFDPDQALDYNCTSWSVNAGMFTPPTDVVFEDLSAMMESLPGVSGDTAGNNLDLKDAQCTACESLTGDAQAQCKAALNCN